MGRRPLGKVAMTGAERVRRYRLKHGLRAPRNEDEAGKLKTRIRELQRELAYYRKQHQQRAAYQAQAKKLHQQAKPSIASDEIALNLIDEIALKMIDAGYRKLAEKAHPDKGGSHDDMLQLNRVRGLLRSWIIDGARIGPLFR
jgi:hypothetical protein